MEDVKGHSFKTSLAPSPIRRRFPPSCRRGGRKRPAGGSAAGCSSWHPAASSLLSCQKDCGFTFYGLQVDGPLNRCTWKVFCTHPEQASPFDDAAPGTVKAVHAFKVFPVYITANRSAARPPCGQHSTRPSFVRLFRRIVGR